MGSSDESHGAHRGGEPDGRRLASPPEALWPPGRETGSGRVADASFKSLSPAGEREAPGEGVGATAGFFAPNLERRGRWVRAVWGLVTLGAGALLVGGEGWRFWVGLGLIALGLLGLVEAWRGWCLARACGLKTRF